MFVNSLKTQYLLSKYEVLEEKAQKEDEIFFLS
jgi:hypothetical protein